MNRLLMSGALLASAVYLAACGGESASDSNSGGAAGGGGSGASAGSGGGSGAVSGGGGSATGGASGSGGGGAVAGSGGGGGASGSGGYQNVVGECKVDADCELVDNCCDCLAGPKGKVTSPPCDAALCPVSRCGSMNIKAARCIAGQCTIGAECDISKAACESLPPTCPAGQVPTVSGACWGPCVPVTACAQVENCFACQGKTCVVNDAWQSTHHCVTPPSNCSGCGCLGAIACIDPYTACTDGIKDGSGVHCSCPTC